MRTQTALEALFVAFVVLLHSSLGKTINKAINCTYPVLKNPIINKTSGSDEVLGCSQCRECGVGKEPEVPCGTTLGIDEGHGDCNNCGEGMYSDAKDTNACKMCRYQLCFEHQRYEGNCTKEKDDSYCLPKCEAKYVMNKEQTKCEVDQSDSKSHTNTTKSAIPTSTTTKHADLNNQKDGKYEIPVAIIAVIVIGILVFGAVIVMIVCYHCRKSKPIPEGGKEENGLDLRNKNEALQVVNYGKHEVNEVNGLSTANVFRPAQETGVHLSADNPGSQAQPATTVQTQQQPTEIVSHASGTNLWKFDKLPYEMYNKICRDFDKNIPGISSDDLAGWLDLTAGEVSRIENVKSKTDAIIQIWKGKGENHDVKHFIKILEDKKVARTLAGEISKCAEQVYK